MKICFKCHQAKPLEEFYRHPRMGDGHLNKCKTCAKADTEARRKIKEATDLQWVEREMQRHREKSARTRSVGKKMPSKVAQEAHKKYSKRHPLKCKAHVLAGNAIRDGKLLKQPCEVCGHKKVQAHHDDYSKPLEVRWLCVKHHNEHHVRERARLRREQWLKSATSIRDKDLTCHAQQTNSP